MKKKNLKSLNLNKRAISNFSEISGIVGKSGSCGVCPEPDSLNALCTATGNFCNFTMKPNDNCTATSSNLIICTPSNER